MDRRAWIGALLFLGCAACGTDEVTPPTGDSGVDVNVNPEGSVAPDGSSDAPTDAPIVTAESGRAVWARRIGEGGDVQPFAVAVDGKGSSIWSGSYMGEVNLAGTGPSGTEVMTAAKVSGYVAKLTPSGGQVWAKTWASTGSGVYPVAIAVDKNDAPIFVGQLFGTATSAAARSPPPGRTPPSSPSSTPQATTFGARPSTAATGRARTRSRW